MRHGLRGLAPGALGSAALAAAGFATYRITHNTSRPDESPLVQSGLTPSFASPLARYALADAAPPTAPKRGRRVHVCKEKGRYEADECEELKIFSGSSNPQFAKAVARGLGTSLSNADVGRFNDGEIAIKIRETVRGDDVYVVQPTSPPVNDNLLELLLFISALRNASAKRVTAIVPYFGYMRSDGSGANRVLKAQAGAASADSQDVPDVVGESAVETHRTSHLAMADVVKMFEVVGCSRVVTFDLHASGQSISEGFFYDTQVENLNSEPYVAAPLCELLGFDKESEVVVLAPHSGCFSKAKSLQTHLKRTLDGKPVGLALVVRKPVPTAKTRNASKATTGGAAKPLPASAAASSASTVVDLVGDVNGRDVLIVEDVVDTGSSLVRAARAAKAAGARHVYSFSSHAVLSGNAPARLQECEELEAVIVLNTVPLAESSKTACPKIKQIDVAHIVSRLIRDLHVVSNDDEEPEDIVEG